MTQTLAQKRAADAWQKTRELLQPKNEDFNDKYASYTASLPATIQMCGLGQAAATLLSAARGKADAHKKLYDNLSNWLCRDEKEAPYRGANDLMEAIVGNDRDAYLRAQAEALAWLEWMKKFATAYLKKPDKGEGGEGNNA